MVRVTDVVYEADVHALVETLTVSVPDWVPLALGEAVMLIDFIVDPDVLAEINEVTLTVTLSEVVTQAVLETEFKLDADCEP